MYLVSEIVSVVIVVPYLYKEVNTYKTRDLHQAMPITIREPDIVFLAFMFMTFLEHCSSSSFTI